MPATEPDNRALASAVLLPVRRLDAIFAARAREFPNRIAVTGNDRELTYAQLDQASDRVAAMLRRHGVGCGSLVGLYIGRGVELIIGMLGILKAGGAYLPLDPAYASARAQLILADSGVSLMVSVRDLAAQLGGNGLRLVLIEDALTGTGGDPAGEPAGVVDAAALAYVIYTSGSTGKPKGVMVAHRNVVRLFEQTQGWFGFDQRDVWCLFHSAGFDFSVWEIWGALLYGGRVVIVPYTVARSPEAFRKLVAEQGVTVLNQTPSAFRGFDEADRRADRALALRYIIFGGEALAPELLAAWMSRHGDNHPALINMYGITETTVHVTYKPMRRQDIVGRTESALGTAIPDLVIHILDEDGNPVADGVVGEMYVEGAGVALGYLQRPELTRERFVELSLPNRAAAVRAYKTGDLALRSSSGELFYKGRGDDQIKVRGFRVEPREIESTLRKSGEVADCCVVAHDYGEGDVRLVAYVVPADGNSWNQTRTAELSELAEAELPDYMRPSAYVALDELPLTTHGKVDKRALPAPDSGTRVSVDAAERAAMPLEETFIVSVWSDELGLKGIGPTDDFFDYGGTSLALIRSLSRIRKHFQLELDPGVLVEGATARNLADFIRTATHKTV